MRSYIPALLACLALTACSGPAASDSDGVNLQRTMKAMGQEWRGLNRSGDTEQQVAHLNELRQQAEQARQGMVRRGEQSQYESGMAEFIEALDAALEALQGEDIAGLADHLQRLDDLRKQHHRSFKP
ncbi:cytochrome b562 [Ferrimonas marina]|uniref:Cytochrome b562 n=1 Tax=Ferrimonas marina TaxID=299255 RepID=A0A1M5MH10_9GAMM|nr:cytochrome b562 [Ferrimonas marina]SHG76487.1 Cytochrome b562 [Ferrimonas marina]